MAPGCSPYSLDVFSISGVRNLTSYRAGCLYQSVPTPRQQAGFFLFFKIKHFSLNSLKPRQWLWSMSKNKRRNKQRKGPFSSHKGGINYPMRNQGSCLHSGVQNTLYIKGLLTRLFPLLPATHYGSHRNTSRPVASVRVRIPASISLHPFFSVCVAQ